MSPHTAPDPYTQTHVTLTTQIVTLISYIITDVITDEPIHPHKLVFMSSSHLVNIEITLLWHQRAV